MPLLFTFVTLLLARVAPAVRIPEVSEEPLSSSDEGGEQVAVFPEKSNWSGCGSVNCTVEGMKAFVGMRAPAHDAISENRIAAIMNLTSAVLASKARQVIKPNSLSEDTEEQGTVPEPTVQASDDLSKPSPVPRQNDDAATIPADVETSKYGLAALLPVFRWIALTAAVCSVVVSCISSLQPAKAALTTYQTGLSH